MQEQTNFNGPELIRLILRRKKGIFGLTGAAILFAIIFSSSFFIPPLYTSEVIIYPPATNSNKALIDYDLRFGDEKEIDEHIQILKSGILRDSMIRKYKLESRYGIEPDDRSAHDHLLKKYTGRVLIDRTRYNAISVTVYDTSPDTAALIANDLVNTGDKVKENILKNNLRSAYSSLEKQYFKVENDLDSIVL